MHLTIGNKLYSSWSMRPWVLMRALDVSFTETVLPLDTPEFKAAIRAVSGAAKVPVLQDGDVTVWDSLAIAEYLADRFPDKAVWPRDRTARAHARSAAAEMHSGFQALRKACPVNLAKRFAPKDRGPEVAADLARIEALWAEARARFGKPAGGPFLYGDFTAADAMFAPLATRLDTYQFEVSAGTRAYIDAILAHSAVQAWRKDALAEPWRLDKYEVGETAVEVFTPT